MDVKSLCLGVLSLGDACGYDIKKYFETTFSHFHGASYGSIYPALAELTNEGLVTCREEPQEGRPDRKIYAITSGGRTAFNATLSKTPPRHRVRSEFLMLLYFAHLMPPHRLHAVLDQRLAELEASIESCKCFLEGPPEGVPPGALFATGLGHAVMTAAHEYLRTHRHAIEQAGAEHSPSDSKQQEIVTSRTPQ